MDTMTIYTIPVDAGIPSDGGRDGCRSMGFLPPGHYLEHPSMPCHADRTVLVPAADPGGLTWRWVDTARVARFARQWTVVDHTLPVDGRNFIGLNFTDEQIAEIGSLLIDGEESGLSMEEAIICWARAFVRFARGSTTHSRSMTFVYREEVNHAT